MAFDKDAFLAGFLNTITDEIDTRQIEARKYQEKQEAAYEQGRRVVQQRDLRGREAAALARKAMQLGATEAQARTAMSSSMTGINDFYEKLQQAANQRGLKKLGEADIEAIMTMPVIPGVAESMADKSLEQFALETYGARAKAAPQQERGGFFASLLDPRGRAKQRLRETDAFGGMSIADVNAAARQADYQSLFGDATVTYTDIDYFTSEVAYDFSTKMTDVANKAVNTDMAKDYIKEERRAVPTGESELKAYLRERNVEFSESDTKATLSMKAMNVAEKMARAEIIQDALEPLIEYYGDTYQHGGFFNNTLAKRSVIDTMGQEWWDTFSSAYAQQSPEEEDEVDPVEAALNPASADPVSPAASDDEGSSDGDATVTPQDIPSVEPRPSGGRAGGTMQWDKKYKGKYNSDGTPIIVEPRPEGPEGDEVMFVEKTFLEKGLSSGDKRRTTRKEEWDRKYGETHNPDGTPKLESE